MPILKRVAVFAATLLAVVGLSSVPAMAAGPLFNCAYMYVCLYENVSFNSGQWYSSFNNISLHSGDCLTIPPATYAFTGDPVNDASSSLVINSDSASGNPFQYYSIYFFNWINCNSDGGVRAYNLDHATTISSLYGLTYNNNTISMARTITSIELIPTALAAQRGLPAPQ